MPRSLKKGRWRELSPVELKDFEKIAGLKPTKGNSTVRADKKGRRDNKRLKPRKVSKK